MLNILNGNNYQIFECIILKFIIINCKIDSSFQASKMDSGRNQPLMNNNYPTLENNNQGWNQPPPQNNMNQGYNPNPNPGYNPNYNPNPYPPQNQGFSPNPMPPQPYGQQPMVPGQQPMPNLNQDKIIIIREHSSMPCRMCGYDGMSTWRQSAGCATYGWCVCLFCFFWPLFWVPFCMDSCYDTEVVCSRCGQVKTVIPADCC